MYGSDEMEWKADEMILSLEGTSLVVNRATATSVSQTWTYGMKNSPTKDEISVHKQPDETWGVENDDVLLRVVLAKRAAECLKAAVPRITTFTKGFGPSEKVNCLPRDGLPDSHPDRKSVV